MADDKGVKVETMKYHTFAGKEYHEGDQYLVNGDAVRSTEEYIETLRAIGFAKPVGEESAKVVNEVGSEASHRADAEKARVKPKDTRVEPMSTGQAKPAAVAAPVAAKPVDVQPNKK